MYRFAEDSLFHHGIKAGAYNLDFTHDALVKK